MDTDPSIPTVTHGSTLRDVVRSIDRYEKGITLLVDEQRHLLRTITDGDVRRALLDRVSLTDTITAAIEQHPGFGATRPVTAPLGATRSELLRLMRERALSQIPLLEESGCVAGLVTLADLIPSETSAMEAVIMAGGRGSRLAPLTAETPKPMLQVGDRPLLEHTLDQLRQAGIEQVRITTHFLGDRIRDYFGDGSKHGLNIDYLDETKPLGTGGALRLVDAKAPMLVINGDVLTRVDFRAMLEFHTQHAAALTLAVRKFDMQVPYGVVNSEGPSVLEISEKPVHEFFVNAGIYLLEPMVLEHLPSDGHFHMTDLIANLLKKELPVVSFPIHEYWLDIGQPKTYEQANRDAAAGGRFHQ